MSADSKHREACKEAFYAIAADGRYGVAGKQLTEVGMRQLLTEVNGAEPADEEVAAVMEAASGGYEATDGLVPFNAWVKAFVDSCIAEERASPSGIERANSPMGKFFRLFGGY